MYSAKKSFERSMQQFAQCFQVSTTKSVCIRY